MKDCSSVASARLQSQLLSPPSQRMQLSSLQIEERKVQEQSWKMHLLLLSNLVATQHFQKHLSDLPHTECPRNEQPILVNDLGNVSLPRSRKSVAGEVTGSSGSSPVSQPQNFLPPLTITYVGFLNSFFLHSCLNSTGKRKRRLHVEN